MSFRTRSVIPNEVRNLLFARSALIVTAPGSGAVQIAATIEDEFAERIFSVGHWQKSEAEESTVGATSVTP